MLQKMTAYRQQLQGILSSVNNGFFKTVQHFCSIFSRKKVRALLSSQFPKN
jgi:hypothetical protein